MPQVRFSLGGGMFFVSPRDRTLAVDATYVLRLLDDLCLPAGPRSLRVHRRRLGRATTPTPTTWDSFGGAGAEKAEYMILPSVEIRARSARLRARWK
jgi:hypothetical protein